MSDPKKELAPKEKRSKADSWKRLVEFRTSKVLAILQQMCHLSNRSLYEYTPEQIAKVFGAIQSALDEAKVMHEKPERRKETSFRL